MKALIKAASGFRGKQFTDWRGGNWQMLGGYGGTGSHPAQVTRAINAYGGTDESSSAVFACVVKIADELAGYERVLTDQTGEPVEPTTSTQDLHDLMEEPQPDTTYFDWAADVATDVELVGNSFYLKDNQNGLGQPENLERFDPAQVTIVTDDQDKKIGYGVYVKGRIIPFTVDDIIHYRSRNPLNRHRGMGRVEALYREVNAELAETAHISSFFFNGARLAGVLTIPEELTDEQFAQLQQQVNDEFGGARNAYKTLIASGATDYKPISAPPAAAGVVEVKRMTLDAIYKGFGVPEFILGGTAQGGVYKMSEAQFIFYRNMLPRARRFQERTTLSLTALWEGTRFVVKPEMSEPPRERMDTAEKMLKVGASLNEGREHAGLPRIEHPQADIPLIPSGMMPYSVSEEGDVRTVTSEPVQVPRRGQGSKGPLPVPFATGRKSHERPLPGHLGQKGDVEGDAEEVEGIMQPTLPDGYEQRGMIYPVKADLETVQIVVEGQAAFLARATPYMANGFRDLFTQQRSRTLARLHDLGRDALREHQVTRKDGVSLSRAELRQKRLRDIFKLFPLTEEDELVTRYLELVDSLGDAALDTANRVIEAGVSWSQQHSHIWAARDAIAKLVTRINETTRTLLAAEIELAVDRGYSIPQIANGNPDENYGGIIGVFDEASSARADTIARTESAFLYNAASTGAYREDGVEEVEVLDGDYDEKCERANGQVWTLREAELHPIEHPNCVRAFAPVVGKSIGVSAKWAPTENANNYPGFSAFTGRHKELALEPVLVERGWRCASWVEMANKMPRLVQEGHLPGDSRANPTGVLTLYDPMLNLGGGKDFPLFREEEHPRGPGGQFIDKPNVPGGAFGGNLPGDGDGDGVAGETDLQRRLREAQELGLNDWPEKGDVANKVLGDYRDTQSKYQDEEGRYLASRKPLHDRLVAETLSKGVADLLDKDDPVMKKLRAGEALDDDDKAHIREAADAARAGEAPRALFMAGGPASGKTSSLKASPELVSEASVEINPDDIKGEIPEYGIMVESGEKYAAMGAHEESSDISKRIYAEATEMGLNIVVDGTGDSKPGKFVGKIEAASAAGYDIDSLYVTIPTDEAVIRATNRAVKSGRWVPEPEIRNQHINVSNNFPAVVNMESVETLKLYDNSGSEPVLIAIKKPGEGLKVLNQELYDQFLGKREETAE